MPLGCSTSRVTFKIFIVFKGWWWLSDRRADSSISCRSRTGRSRLPISLGNKRSFRRQPRFQQDELQSLVTRWKGLLSAPVTSRILGHHLKWKALVLLRTCFLPAFGSTECKSTEIQTERERAIFWALRCQESKLPPRLLAIFQEGKDPLMALEISRVFGSFWFQSMKIKEVLF